MCSRNFKKCSNYLAFKRSSLVSLWFRLEQSPKLGRYESQYTLRGDTRTHKPGKYKIGEIIGATPRFIENGIGRQKFDEITLWVLLLLILG